MCTWTYFNPDIDFTLNIKITLSASCFDVFTAQR